MKMCTLALTSKVYPRSSPTYLRSPPTYLILVRAVMKKGKKQLYENARPFTIHERTNSKYQGEHHKHYEHKTQKIHAKHIQMLIHWLIYYFLLWKFQKNKPIFFSISASLQKNDSTLYTDLSCSYLVMDCLWSSTFFFNSPILDISGWL